jgi:hypothetical protein
VSWPDQPQVSIILELKARARSIGYTDNLHFDMNRDGRKPIQLVVNGGNLSYAADVLHRNGHGDYQIFSEDVMVVYTCDH